MFYAQKTSVVISGRYLNNKTNKQRAVLIYITGLKSIFLPICHFHTDSQTGSISEPWWTPAVLKTAPDHSLPSGDRDLAVTNREAISAHRVDRRHKTRLSVSQLQSKSSGSAILMLGISSGDTLAAGHGSCRWLVGWLVGWLVSWCFEPSQPHRGIISRLIIKYLFIFKQKLKGDTRERTGDFSIAGNRIITT